MPGKTDNVRSLIFSILDILKSVGISMDYTTRRLERMAMACLAVGQVKTNFAEVKSAVDNCFSTTREIISFENKYYGENISSGSYDDIRRKDLILLVEANIIINSSAFERQATNNPTRGYALDPSFANLIKHYGSQHWNDMLNTYKTNIKLLNEHFKRERDLKKIPVTLPSGLNLLLSTGEHNILQKNIIENFLSRFGMGAEVLYVGDTSDKYLYMNTELLTQIKFFPISHDELPDIVAYAKDKNLLFLIEAVYSSGPMSEIRVSRLKKQLQNCVATSIFVTAFLDKKTFRRWASDIAWETEVWIADTPEHMIHFNGHKFLEIH